MCITVKFQLVEHKQGLGRAELLKNKVLPEQNGAAGGGVGG